MHLRPRGNIGVFYRGIASGLALLLCLPAPDLFAQSSPRSIFAGKQATHTSIQQRNLRELDAKQGMIQKQGSGAGDQGPGTHASTVHGPPSTVTAKPLSLASLQDLSALSIPPEDGQILEVWQPDEAVVGRRSQVVGEPLQVVGPGSYDVRPTTSDAARGPTVLLLQDLHTQPEAQQAEGRILEHLYKTYDIRLVASEGAADPFDLAFFQQFPRSKELRARVADALLQLGEMTGHEYQAIVEQLPVTMQGVDDPALYTEDLEVFRLALARQPAVQQALETVGSALGSIEVSVVHEPLQALLLDERRFEQGTLALPDYAGRLLVLARQIGVDADALAPNVVRLPHLAEMEKALPLRDEIDRQQRVLVQAVTEAAQVVGHRAQALALVELLQRWQAGQVGVPYAFERLTQLAAESGVAFEEYPAVQAFTEYLRQSRSLQTHALMAELDRLLSTLGDRLAQTDDERAWWTLCRTHRLLVDAVGLTLTRAQLAAYRQQRPSFASIVEFCIAHGHRVEGELSVVDAFLPTIEQFYGLAEQRDRAMVDNTLRWVQEASTVHSPSSTVNHGLSTADTGHAALSVEHEALGAPAGTAANGARPTTYDVRHPTYDATRPEAVVLIAGGFHTEGMTALLRERGVPYVVVTPTASGTVDEALYHRLIVGTTAGVQELVAAVRATSFVRTDDALMAPGSLLAVRPVAEHHAAASSQHADAVPQGRRGKWLMAVVIVAVVLAIGGAVWLQMADAARLLDPVSSSEVLRGLDTLQQSLDPSAVAPTDGTRVELGKLHDLLQQLSRVQVSDAGDGEAVISLGMAKSDSPHKESRPAQDGETLQDVNRFVGLIEEFADRYVAEQDAAYRAAKSSAPPDAARDEWFRQGVHRCVADVLCYRSALDKTQRPRFTNTMEELVLARNQPGQPRGQVFGVIEEVNEVLSALPRDGIYKTLASGRPGHKAFQAQKGLMEQNIRRLERVNRLAEAAEEFAIGHARAMTGTSPAEMPEASVVEEGISQFFAELRYRDLLSDEDDRLVNTLSALGRAYRRGEEGVSRAFGSLGEAESRLSRTRASGSTMTFGELYGRAGDWLDTMDDALAQFGQWQQDDRSFLAWLSGDGRRVLVEMVLEDELTDARGRDVSAVARLSKQLFARGSAGQLRPLYCISQGFDRSPVDRAMLDRLKERWQHPPQRPTVRRADQALEKLLNASLALVAPDLPVEIYVVTGEPEQPLQLWYRRDTWGLIDPQHRGGILIVDQRLLSSVQQAVISEDDFARGLARAIPEFLMQTTGLQRRALHRGLAALGQLAWPSVNPDHGPDVTTGVRACELALWQWVIVARDVDAVMRSRIYLWLMLNDVERSSWSERSARALVADPGLLQRVLLDLAALVARGQVVFGEGVFAPQRGMGERLRPVMIGTDASVESGRLFEAARRGVMAFAGVVSRSPQGSFELVVGALLEAYWMASEEAVNAQVGVRDEHSVRAALLMGVLAEFAADGQWEPFVDYLYRQTGRPLDARARLLQLLREHRAPAQLLLRALSRGRGATAVERMLDGLEREAAAQDVVASMTFPEASRRLNDLLGATGVGGVDFGDLGLLAAPGVYADEPFEKLQDGYDRLDVLRRVEDAVRQSGTAASAFLANVGGARGRLQQTVREREERTRLQLYSEGMQACVDWMGEPSAEMGPHRDPTFPPPPEVWRAVRDLGSIRPSMTTAGQQAIDTVLASACLHAARLEGEELEFFQDVRSAMAMAARHRIDRVLLQQWVDQGEGRYELRPAMAVSAGAVVEGLAGPAADAREVEETAVLLTRIVEKFEPGGVMVENFAALTGYAPNLSEEFCNRARASFRTMAVPFLRWWLNLSVHARKVEVWGSQPIARAVHAVAHDQTLLVQERLDLLEAVWRAAGGIEPDEKVLLGEERLNDPIVRAAAETEMERLRPAVESLELGQWRREIDAWSNVGGAKPRRWEPARDLMRQFARQQLANSAGVEDIGRLVRILERVRYAAVRAGVREALEAMEGRFPEEVASALQTLRTRAMQTIVGAAARQLPTPDARPSVEEMIEALDTGPEYETVTEMPDGEAKRLLVEQMLEQLGGDQNEAVARLRAWLEANADDATLQQVFGASAMRRPNRFRVEVWRAFKAKLQALEGRFAGLAELVERYGLAWTDPQGRIHFIDEMLILEQGYGAPAVNAVWEAARAALNEAADQESDQKHRFKTVDDVKRMIGYHESLHAQFSDRMHQALIHHFRRRVEEIVGSFPIESGKLLQHPFFAAMSATYGDPPNMHTMSVDGLINWYVEEFFVQSIQEVVWFNDPQEVWRRLAAAVPELEPFADAVRQEVDRVIQLVGWDEIRPVIWHAPPVHYAAGATVLQATDRSVRALAFPWRLSRSYLAVNTNGPASWVSGGEELALLVKDQPVRGYPSVDLEKDRQLFLTAVGSYRNGSGRVVLGGGGPTDDYIDPMLRRASPTSRRGKMGYVWWQTIFVPFLAARGFNQLSARNIAASFEFVERRRLGKMDKMIFGGILSAPHPVDTTEMDHVVHAYEEGRVSQLSGGRTLRQMFPQTYAAVYDFLSIESPSELRTCLEVFEAWERIWLVGRGTGVFHGAVARQQGAFRGMYLPQMADQPEVLGEIMVRLLGESANLSDQEIRELVVRYHALRTGDQTLREARAMASVVREVSMMPIGPDAEKRWRPVVVVSQLKIWCAEAVAVVQRAGDRRPKLLPWALMELEVERPHAAERVRQWLGQHARDVELQDIFGAALLIMAVVTGVHVAHELGWAMVLPMTVRPLTATPAGPLRVLGEHPFDRARREFSAAATTVESVGVPRVFLFFDQVRVSDSSVEVTVRYLDEDGQGRVVEQADRCVVDRTQLGQQLSDEEARRAAFMVIDQHYARLVEAGRGPAFVDQTRWVTVRAGNKVERLVYKPSPVWGLESGQGSTLATEAMANDLCRELGFPVPEAWLHTQDGYGWRVALPGDDLDGGLAQLLLYEKDGESVEVALLRRAEELGRWASAAILLMNSDVYPDNILLLEEKARQGEIAVIDQDVVFDPIRFELYDVLNTQLLDALAKAVQSSAGSLQIVPAQVTGAFLRGLVSGAGALQAQSGRQAVDRFLGEVRARGGLMVRRLLRLSDTYATGQPVPLYCEWVDAGVVEQLVEQQYQRLGRIARGEELLVADPQDVRVLPGHVSYATDALLSMVNGQATSFTSSRLPGVNFRLTAEGLLPVGSLAASTASSASTQRRTVAVTTPDGLHEVEVPGEAFGGTSTASKPPLFGSGAAERVTFIVSDRAAQSVQGLRERLQGIGDVVMYAGQDLTGVTGVFVGVSAEDFGRWAQHEAFPRLFVSIDELASLLDPAALVDYFNRRFNDPDAFHRWQESLLAAAQSA